MDKLEKVIKAWECCDPFNRRCFECPYDADCLHDSFDRVAIADTVKLLKEQQPIWNDASKRPPKEGRYLVWGLHEFTPDHNDQPNAYWQTRIANWSNHFGWNTKVKFWMELPEPPENKGR